MCAEDLDDADGFHGTAAVVLDPGQGADEGGLGASGFHEAGCEEGQCG